MWGRVFSGVVMMALLFAEGAFADLARSCSGRILAEVTSASPDIPFKKGLVLHSFRGRGVTRGIRPNEARRKAREAVLDCGEDAIHDAMFNNDRIAEEGGKPPKCRDGSKIPEYNVNVIGCTMYKKVCEFLKNNHLDRGRVQYLTDSSGDTGCGGSKHIASSVLVRCVKENFDKHCKP